MNANERRQKIDEAMECVFAIDGWGRRPLSKVERRAANKRLETLKRELGIRRMCEVVELDRLGTKVIRYL